MKTCGQCKHWSEYNKAWSSGVCKPPKPLPIWASPGRLRWSNQSADKCERFAERDAEKRATNG